MLIQDFSYFIFSPMVPTIALADLGGQKAHPHGPKSSQFHAVFRKIWQFSMLAPLDCWRPS